MPSGYGIPSTRDGMLSWVQVARAFASAPRYWIATTNADGAPHVIQQWGAWVDGALYFEGGTQTRWARNLRRDARLVATAERAGLAIMVEGQAERLAAPTLPLARRIIAAYGAKPYGYKPRRENWRAGGLIALRPRRVFAWRYKAFNTTATRFAFDP